VSHLTYQPMSTPHRWLLFVVCLAVAGLVVVMMARTVDQFAPNDTSNTASRIESGSPPVKAPVAADQDEAPRIPLPAGPRRFQEAR
jgi:hypothetical protein